jgi:16S rRNA (uracil1498-N3)-methyltransferase
MKRVLCDRLPEPNRATPLSDAEANHLTRVLRLKDGDRVEAMDGKGHQAGVTLRTRSGAPRLEFLEKPVSSQHPDRAHQRVPVILEMAVLKGDAMEWVVEKAVELGISALVPVVTAHTVVQLDKKGPEAFRERWQKIADQALKQCGRLDRLEIKMPIEFQLLMTQAGSAPRLWCDESARDHAGSLMNWLSSHTQAHAQTSAQSGAESSGDTQASANLGAAQFSGEVRVLIGPEGGWSELERQLLSQAPDTNIPVSLGPLVMRAETAAIFALSLVSAHFRERK